MSNENNNIALPIILGGIGAIALGGAIGYVLAKKKCQASADCSLCPCDPVVTNDCSQCTTDCSQCATDCSQCACDPVVTNDCSQCTVDCSSQCPCDPVVTNDCSQCATDCSQCTTDCSQCATDCSNCPCQCPLPDPCPECPECVNDCSLCTVDCTQCPTDCTQCGTDCGNCPTDCSNCPCQCPTPDPSSDCPSFTNPYTAEEPNTMIDNGHWGWDLTWLSKSARPTLTIEQGMAIGAILGAPGVSLYNNELVFATDSGYETLAMPGATTLINW